MAGFTKPTTTPTPDALFDHWLPRLAGAEMRVLLYAVRRTFGFSKDADTISLDQFQHGITTRDGRVLDEGTGIRGRSTLTSAVKKLTVKGLLIKEKRSDPDYGDLVNNYRLVITDNPTVVAAYGFRPVNTTPVPDELFDYWLPRLSDAELFVLLYVIRRTLGFRKNADTISVRQFLEGVHTRDGQVLDEGCGIRTRRYLYLALNGLQGKGLIASERRIHAVRGNLSSRYRLVFEGDAPLVLKVDPRSLPDHDEGETRVMRTTLRVPDAPVDPPDTRNPITEPTGVRLVNRGGTISELSGRPITAPTGVQSLTLGSTTSAPTPSTEAGHGAVQQQHSQETAQQATDAPTGIDKEAGDSKLRNHPHTIAAPLLAEPPDAATVGVSAITARPHPSRQETNAVPKPTEAQRQQLRLDPAYQALLATIAELAEEFGDEAPVRSSTTRAYNDMHAAKVTVDDMLGLLDEAAALTRTYHGSITKRRSGGTGKNRMPYFFSVLERLLQPDASPSPRHEPSSPALLTTGPASADDEPHPVWRAVKEDLRQTMTTENYTTWIKDTRVVAEDNGLLHIAVPKPLHKDWLEMKLAMRITMALQRLGYGAVRLEYVVVPRETEAG